MFAAGGDGCDEVMENGGVSSGANLGVNDSGGGAFHVWVQCVGPVLRVKALR